MKKIALMAIVVVAAALGGEKRAVAPASGPKPVGPYSPGILTSDFLYVAGQGARSPSGQMPQGFEAQTRQCLENVKAIVEAAGLTMAHVVYSQVYLDNIANYDTMNRVWAQYFPKSPPARATLGVARMPTDTPVEINAVVIRDLASRKAIPPSPDSPPISIAVEAKDRVFVSGMLGWDEQRRVPDDPSKQVELAMAGMERTLKSAGVDLAYMIFTNVYIDPTLPAGPMNAVYAKYFEHGNTPARATIPVSSLPLGAHVEITGVAVKDLRTRRAVRPRNMAPSRTASPCVFVGDTYYCSAKAGFIPGPHGGIYADDVQHQVRQTMRNLLDGLEEAGLDFSHVVATNVYLDNIEDFAKMNDVYKLYFGSMPPARTTVQPLKPVDRKRDSQGRFPKLEEISLIAVR